MKHRGSSNRGTLSRLSWSIGCGLVVEEKSGKERERDKDEWRERERECEMGKLLLPGTVQTDNRLGG